MPRARAQTAVLLAGALTLALACGSGPGDGSEAGEGAGAPPPRPAAGETTEAAPAASVRAGDSPQEADSALAGGGPAAETAQSSETTRLQVDGLTVTVEVADDPEERHRGLMGRDSLPDDHGMLFVYSEERRLSFWMRDTRIPLDIAFLDRNGYIVDIQQMDPHTEELHESRRPAMYALEMRKGWFEEHGIEEGARVRF